MFWICHFHHAPIEGDSLRYPPKMIEVWIQEASVLNSLTRYSSPPPPPSSSATSSPLSSAPPSPSPSPSPPPPPLPSTSRLKSAPTSENEDEVEVEEDQLGNSDGSFDWDAFDEPGDLDGLP